LDDDLEELNRDYQLLKKRKRGKITEEEFEEQMGLNSLPEDTTHSIVDPNSGEPTQSSETCQDPNMFNLIENVPPNSTPVATAINKNDNNTLFNVKKKKHRKKKKKPILIQ
jgi:hypothetical protein